MPRHDATARPAAQESARVDPVRRVEEGRADTNVNAAPEWVLLREEGRARGFRNALAFRRWCRRRGVTVQQDGRLQWVRPVEVDAAIAALAQGGACVASVANDLDPVAEGVRDLIMGAGRRR